MIVENDPDSLDALATLLQIEGIEVVAVETKDCAYDMLLEGARPAAIILDVWTPGMTAREFLRAKGRARPELSRIPVVALSGDLHALEGLTAEDPGGGFAASFGKPFDIDALIAVIHDLRP